MITLTWVHAVRLLQLRAVSRAQLDLPARRVAPGLWIKALRLMLRRPRCVTSVRDFVCAMASRGGFLGRKHDAEPG